MVLSASGAAGDNEGMHILAWDIGTSAVKAAVLDVSTGRAVGPIGRVPLVLTQQGESATLDPEQLWSVLVQLTHELTADRRVSGIGFCCLTPGWLLLDGEDRALTPIVTHLDRRARPLAQRLWQTHGEEFLQETGNKPLPGGLSGIACAQVLQEQPELRPKVRRFLHVNSWLCLRLTGQTAFDWGNACFTGLFDWRRQCWSKRWCEHLGIRPEWLPQVTDGSTTIGGLTGQAARILGLPSGLPVKVGIADTSAAVLAAGMQFGDLLHLVGTTQVLATLVPQPQSGPDHLTRMLGVGQQFLHVTHNPVGGVALEWMHRLCFRDQSAEEFYRHTVSAAWQRPTVVALDPPYLGGDRLAIEPTEAAFRHLRLDTDRLDLLAALLRAMYQQHHRALAALHVPLPFRRIFLSGGGAEIIAQLFPEYRQAELTVLVEGSLSGVARLFAADLPSDAPASSSI
jgi:xylulokinase